MRAALAIGLSALALIGSIGPSEARFRLRLSSGHSSAGATSLVPAPSTRRAVAASTILYPVGVHGARTAEALAPGETGGIGLPPAPEPAVHPQPKAEAEPWCPSGRVAGSGAGFCVVN